jgi:L-lactate dehydrogenase complex protein LldF
VGRAGDGGTPRSRAKAALADGRAVAARGRGFAHLRPRVAQVIGENLEVAPSLRRLKLEALALNEQLVRQAMERMRANGMKVFLARTNQEAVDYVLSVMPAPGLVVKAKSNLGKELHLAEALLAGGLDVIETDLGDRINQLAGTPGGHVLAPAVSKDRGEIRELFERELGRALSSDPGVLVSAARESLRGYLERADYGLTGINSVAADTGTICLMENEGNIRSATALPRVHVAVAGIHKVMPTLEQAMMAIQGASLFAGGQSLANYVTCISGPGDGTAGPQEVHVVLVDNGRTQAVADGYAEAFACVNCGSCLNFCPVYELVGDTFGGRRIGGIGCLQTSLLDGVAAGDEDGASLCIKCGKCRTVCPVQLDTPGLLTRLQDERGLSRRDTITALMGAVVADPRLLRTMGRFVRLYQKTGLQPLVRRSGVLRPMGLEGAEALLPTHPAPKVDPVVSLAARGGERVRVAFFRGCLAGELLSQVNADTLEVLVTNGCRVSVPREQACCGAIHEHAGDKDKARELARQNIDAFRGDEVIVTNSGGCGVLLKLYGELLEDDPVYAGPARDFASRVRDLSEFLVDLGLREMPGIDPPVRVTYQDSCHLSLVQGIREQPREVLRSIPGVEFVEMDPRQACCGSGGLWGLKYPELSQRLRQIKLEDAELTGATIVATGNPGCYMHLQGGSVEVKHVVELLAAAYRGGSLGTVAGEKP